MNKFLMKYEGHFSESLMKYIKVWVLHDMRIGRKIKPKVITCLLIPEDKMTTYLTNKRMRKYI